MTPRRPQMSSAESPPAALLDWYGRNARDLPWRRTKDPYRIWVSEIMLQQTRVEAVLPYYRRFLERYPDVAVLAATTEAELLEAWAGLGYYRRARQLRSAARAIVADHGAAFPSKYDAIRALPGVGDYTAAAIASIAFDRPHAAVDGNVVRVLSRYLDDDRDVTKPAVRRALTAVVQAWIEATPEGCRGDFTQAVIEVGATVCSRTSPRCMSCPLYSGCRAAKRGTQAERPVKSRRQRLEKRTLHVLLCLSDRGLLLRRRAADEAIMPGFWEAPQAERLEDLDGLGLEIGAEVGRFRHGITFRSFEGIAYEARPAGPLPDGYRWAAEGELDALPVSTVTRKAFATFEPGPG